MTVNDDFSKLAVVHTDREEWRTSPGSIYAAYHGNCNNCLVASYKSSS